MKKVGNKKKARDNRKRCSVNETLIAFHILAGATVEFFHCLKTIGAQVHHEGELSDTKRSVLMSLHRLGPQTVPQIARSRQVSRQNIQTIVNLLLDDGYVELIDNPAHKRSSMVSLTLSGESFVEEMNLLETEILSRLDFNIENREILKAAEVLKSLKKTFESRKWKELIEEFNP